MTPPPLVLASTSPYRADLLARLGLSFSTLAPEVDETPLPDEAPAQRARRLAAAKADAIARKRRDAVVIGSDQVAALDGQVLGKPGSEAVAREQLGAAAGREVRFFTATRVAAPIGHRDHVDLTTVAFRPLDTAEISRYVASEKPLDCAGSFKAEGLGIALFQRIETQDPTALIGLPLIWLAGALRALGYRVP